MRDVIALVPPPLGLDSKHLHTLPSPYLLALCCAGKGMCALRIPAEGRSSLGLQPCLPAWSPVPGAGPAGTAGNGQPRRTQEGQGTGLWGGREVGFTALFTWLVLPLTLNAFVGL